MMVDDVHRLGRAGHRRPGGQRRRRAPVRLAVGLPGPGALVALTGSLAIPSLIRLGPAPERAAGEPGAEHRAIDGIGAAAGRDAVPGRADRAVGLGLPGGSSAPCSSWAGPDRASPLLRRLLPPGAIAARPGLPVTVDQPRHHHLRVLRRRRLRDADHHHRAALLPGAGRTGGDRRDAVVDGPGTQARLSERQPGRPLVRTGLLLVHGRPGAGMALVLLPAVPIAAAIAAWTVAGAGMGLGYAPLSLLMMRQAPPGREAADGLAEPVRCARHRDRHGHRRRCRRRWPCAAGCPWRRRGHRVRHLRLRSSRRGVAVTRRLSVRRAEESPLSTANAVLCGYRVPPGRGRRSWSGARSPAPSRRAT